MFELAIQVAGLGDVRAAPVLARHGGFGERQFDLLVSFGEPGLRALLEFAPETRPHDNGTDLGHVRVLATLHLYLYDRGVEALDTETLDEIRGLAARTLAGPADPMVLEWGAMGLALLVGGPELRATVEEMAASDEAVRRGPLLGLGALQLGQTTSPMSSVQMLLVLAVPIAVGCDRPPGGATHLIRVRMARRRPLRCTTPQASKSW